MSVAAATAVLAAPDPAAAQAAAGVALSLTSNSPLRCRRSAPLAFADADVLVPSYVLPAAITGARAGEQRALSDIGASRVDDLVSLMHASAKPWALRPTSPGRLRSMLTGLAGLQELSAPDTTLAQERSNFKYWTAWCAEWNTTVTRPAARSLDADEYVIECAFWGASVPWIHERMYSRHGVLGEAQPQSALAVVRGIKRAFQRLGIETVPLTAAVKACDGMLRVYIETHGPEALIPHRKEPLTLDIITGMLAQEGGKLGRVPLDWARPEMQSLRAMFHTLAQTGFRKSEVSLHPKVRFGPHHLSMANCTWLIGGTIYKSITPALAGRLAAGDFALLRPPPSKSDQFSLHWGASTIYLPWQPPSVAICAARELAREELRRGIAEDKRREAPLFVSAAGGPWRHEALNTVFHHLIVRVVGTARAAHYSMHSWRVYLACALLAAGASSGTIQSMLRWRSDDALRIYARINDSKYGDWLGLAQEATVSSVRTTTASALAESLRTADPAPENGHRLAAFQTYWLEQARERPPTDDMGALNTALGGVEIDDSRRVALLEGATSAMLAAAERADAADAELAGRR